VERGDLIWKVRRAADEAGRDWALVREGGSHEIWLCGVTEVPVPRHREITEGTARRVMRALEGEPGEDWWRR
jgi:mRNA interferase HicA